MTADVVIVGGGLGGLVCGNLLSRYGMKTLVLERGAQLGGCLQSYRRGGTGFDTGFHYVGGLGRGESLERVFRLLGLMDLPWRQMDKVYDMVHIAGKAFSLAQGWDDFVDALAADFPAERNALEEYASMVRRCCHSWNGNERSAVINELMEVNAWDYLNSQFHNPLLIDVLSGQAIRMELRKESLPLYVFVMATGGFIESSWRLEAEGSLIAETLAKGIRERGGMTVCNAEVKALVEEDGRIVAAETEEGTAYRGQWFISDVHPAVTLDLVKDSKMIKRLYRRRITSLDNTCGMFTVSLKLKPDVLPYTGRNHYVYSRPGVWSLSEESSEVVGVMVSERCPRGGDVCTDRLDLLTPTPLSRWSRWSDTSVGRRGDDYERLKCQMADQCIALAETVMPGLGDMVERRWTSSPLTWRDYTLTPDGSAYGIRKDCRQPMLTMLSPKTPVPNLLMTGQSLMLHGVCGVTMTALHTCAEILGPLQMF